MSSHGEGGLQGLGLGIQGFRQIIQIFDARSVNERVNYLNCKCSVFSCRLIKSLFSKQTAKLQRMYEYVDIK